MESSAAIEFKKKLDEVLRDTENFVNATKQLNVVKKSLDEYISSVKEIDSKLSKTITQTSRCTDYAEGFFNGNLTKEIDELLETIKEIVASCEDEALRLKNQYDDILRSDNFTELQADHSTIMDIIDGLESKVDKLAENESENSLKLDLILERLSIE